MPSRTRTAITAAAGTAALAGLLAGPAVAAGTHQVRGTVIHHNNRAHSFVVATPAGALYAVHAAKSPALGSLVSVSVSELRNGTYAAHQISAHGHQARGRAVRAHGVVTYVNRAAHTYTLSAHGVSLLVHTGRTAHDTTTTQPTVGSVVTTTGTIDNQGEMDAETTDVQGEDTNGYELEGTVLSVDSAANTITISADDSDVSGQSITISVPAPLTTADFHPGDEVELDVQYANGTYTLLGSSDDNNAQGADDQGEEQGQYSGDEGEGEGSGTSSDAGE